MLIYFMHKYIIDEKEVKNWSSVVFKKYNYYTEILFTNYSMPNIKHTKYTNNGISGGLKMYKSKTYGSVSVYQNFYTI